VYDLGFGTKAYSLKEAGELLLKREYPKISECHQKEFDYIFIPDSYLYEGLTEKVKHFIIFSKKKLVISLICVLEQD